VLGGYAFAEEMKPGDMPVKNDAGMVKKGPHDERLLHDEGWENDDD
jgi:hypothetical protein